MARAVLFDMDGVLAFTEQFYNRRRVDYLVEKGFRFDSVPDFSGSNDPAIWEALVPGDAELRRRLHDGYLEYMDAHPTPWREVMNPDALPVMHDLHSRGVRCAICSSSGPELIGEFMRAAGVEPYVDLSISGEDCREFKPSPEIYLTAMGQLGVRARDCVVVEDSPIGIRAGKASGALVCALRPRPGVSLDQRGADVVVGSLREVLPLALGPHAVTHGD
ncbi:MAG: HAD family phosphatase [Coriobacteriaceae bacterium]|jgi:HAD superfamily hydrolase (TIGR01509 family)|nr:HAD family phosphatase [Olsenella sp.]RRF88599.1 MAG: HAD family phosphatase [Coriobacteriaceae bacterium]